MAIIMVPPADEAPWPTLGPLLVPFIEQNMVHGPGDLFGRPVRLNDEQRAWIYRMYEVHPPHLVTWKAGRSSKARHPRAGKRRFERCVLSLRKGSSKTEFAAWVAGAELHPDAPVRCAGFDAVGGVPDQPIGRGVTDPYIPMISYAEEQTEELAYGALRRILEECPLAADFDIGLERIMRRGGDGKAEAVSASPNARDGARTTWMHADEALALDTPLPTPTGWTTMGAVAVGDHLISSTGRPCRVVGKSPVHHGRPCYRVTFADGSSVVADEGHLWLARRSGGCGHGRGCRCDITRGWAVRTTGSMRATRFRVAGRWSYRYHVPVGAPLDTPAVPLPIDPYVLGVWLGDGDAANATITVGAEDREALEASIHAAGYGVTRCQVRPTAAPLLYLTAPDGAIPGRLRALELLRNKHIPAMYLRAGTAQRWALLQGLMDADGSISARGDCVFVNTNSALVAGVVELCRTLGFAPAVHWREDGRKASYRPVAKVSFQSDQRDPVFRLPRKRARLRPRRHPRHEVRAIVSIEPVPSVAVQCLKVDAPDALFRAGAGMVLTHNTHRLTLDHLKRAWTVMLGNLGKRPIADPWALETTTAPEPGAGSVAETTMDYATSLAEKPEALAATRLFFFHREASASHDLSTDTGLREAILEASGPYIAQWTDVDRIAQRFHEEDGDPAYAERVWLNRRVQATAKAFDAAQWKTFVRPGYVVPKGAAITIGFDGSRYDDATGLVGTELETGYQWVLGVWERPETQKDWEVPVTEVDGAVEDAFARWQVTRMYCDPPKWESWVAHWAGRFGEKRVFEWWTNRRRPMAFAIRAYRTAQLAGEVSHDGDPAFTRHIGNACRALTNLYDENDKPLWILRKERPDSPHKIDLAMAGTLAWEARTDSIAAGEQKRKLAWVL